HRCKVLPLQTPYLSLPGFCSEPDKLLRHAELLSKCVASLVNLRCISTSAAVSSSYGGGLRRTRHNLVRREVPVHVRHRRHCGGGDSRTLSANQRDETVPVIDGCGHGMGLGAALDLYLGRAERRERD